MPLVDFGTFENTYSARIANSGTASITSQSSDFIASVSYSTTGTTIGVFKTGFFTQIPSLVIAPTGGATQARYTALSATGFTIEISNSGGTLVNADYSITVQRQGSDYKQPPQPTAAVIKPAVAILYDKKAYNVDGGTNTSNVWKDRELNIIEGESWFVTLSGTGTTGIGGTNVEFTLDPGTYEIESNVPNFYCAYASQRLTDVTNGNIVLKYGNSAYSANSSTAISSTLFHSLTIGSSTQYKIENIAGNGVATYGLGIRQHINSDAYSVFTQVKIRKLK
jgi:hypothetical protein